MMENIEQQIPSAEAFLKIHGFDTTHANVELAAKMCEIYASLKVEEERKKLKCFTPDILPKRSKDAPEFSVTVCIIDEGGLDGLAYFDYENNEWRFHTDTLVDYNEAGAETLWMWYYPPVSWEKAVKALNSKPLDK